MKHYKLPFKIELEQKYNDLNISSFIRNWKETKSIRKSRSVAINNDLHIELSKFKTYDVSISEIIDVAMRYALNKQEFKKIAAELIEIKAQKK